MIIKHNSRPRIEFGTGPTQRICAGSVLLVHWFFTAIASAATDSSTVNLRWERGSGAEACAGQTELEALVKTRLGRDPFSSDATRTLDASVSSESNIWHVELRVRDQSGDSLGQRVFDVHAESCDPVVDAVSLAAALAIDPNANLKLDLKATKVEGNQTGMADGAPGDKADESEHKDNPKVLPSPYPYAQLLAPVQAACPTPSPWGTRFALRGVAAAGLLPGVAPGVELAASLDRAHSHAVLGISYFAEATLDSRFAIGLTTVDVGYCHDVLTTHRTALGVCAGAHVGSQHVVVRQLRPVSPGDHFIAGASLGPKFDWVLWRPLYLQAGISAWVPIPGAHPSFYISGQNSPVFESHVVSGLAFLGAGFMTN